MVTTSPTVPRRRRGQYDLPLRRDTAARFLPGLIALMVFLAALATAAAMILSDIAKRWESGLTGALTVEVRPLTGSGNAPVEARVGEAMALLRATPGVAEAKTLPREDSLRLVERWLGGAGGRIDAGLAAALPLPVLIDVRLLPTADPARLTARLAEIPGVTAEDPGSWLADLRRLAETVQWIAMAVVGLIGGASVVAVVFAASSGLAVHRADVELLHTIGAPDAYVAAQFQRHVVRLTLVGGGTGLGLALITLYGLDRVAQQLEAALLPELTLSPAQWLLLPAIPLAGTVLAAVTARITVLRALGRMS